MWIVCVDTYSLEAGQVGRYVTPVARYQHRTAGAAARRLGSLISGKLRRSVPNGRRFYVVAPDGRELSCNAVRVLAQTLRQPVED